MTRTSFIQVILPLRLEWEPYYKVPQQVEVQVGDRVRVIFANAFYVGTVSEINVTPNLDPGRILPIEAVEEDLPVVSPEEIRFWREIAAYYLCTVGEVYKAAYPRMAHHKSRLVLPATQEPNEAPAVDESIIKSFGEGKPVLVCGTSRTDLYLNQAFQTWKEGKSTLILVPEVALSSQLEEQIRKVFPTLLVYNSHLTPGKRKAVAEKLRSGDQYVLLGTRSALLLPNRNLGLVVVDEEHDPSFKQDSPAPRYHARESGIMLALSHGAKVILGSATPSLESVYNAQCGRFVRVDLKENSSKGKITEVEIISIGAEIRKNGMNGSFSLKLLAHMQNALEAGEQILVLGPRRSYFDGRKLEAEVLEIFPDVRLGSLNEGTAEEQLETLRAFAAGEFDILVGNNLSTKGIESRKLGLVAIVAADGILSRQDFRADERAVQVLKQQKGHCARFVIQTREPHHPVFQAILEGKDPTDRIMEERRQFGYPPFSRLVKVQVRDKYEKRLGFFTHDLVKELGSISPVTGPYAPSWWPIPDEKVQEMLLLLPRDKELSLRKQAISRCISAFEQAKKYPGHIVIDVDPV
jgi:primosomal protein N' (replication factor Y)